MEMKEKVNMKELTMLIDCEATHNYITKESMKEFYITINYHNQLKNSSR